MSTPNLKETELVVASTMTDLAARLPIQLPPILGLFGKPDKPLMIYPGRRLHPGPRFMRSTDWPIFWEKTD